MFNGEKMFPPISETGERNDKYKHQNRWPKSVLVANNVTKYIETKRINRRMITTIGSNT